MIAQVDELHNKTTSLDTSSACPYPFVLGFAAPVTHCYASIRVEIAASADRTIGSSRTVGSQKIKRGQPCAGDELDEGLRRGLQLFADTASQS